ncbi:MAG: epoxyqueuosine reductase QueH [Clostridiales Family XIII bacterium]|nr:epoxyqueuosine reductase QueH [Clostridiales Family XIII bacterium]
MDKRICERETESVSLPQGDVHLARPSVLLHSCCGPCSTAVIERLAERYRIVIFFYNPNIDDEEEYKRRLKAQEDFVKQYNASINYHEPITIVRGNWNSKAFHERSKGLEDEPEGGKRCRLCIEQRMEVTAEYAAMNGFENFTTTLSVSPHKDYEMILSIGRNLAARFGINFVNEDFKKKNGFLRSIELSKAHELYRQNYCGCNYSKRTVEPSEVPE